MCLQTDTASGAPRNVLVYSTSWLPRQVDGVAVRMDAHVRSLVDRGIKVTLISPDFVHGDINKEKTPMKTLSGVEHITVESEPTPVYRKNLCMRQCVRNIWTLYSTIKRVKPDLVHATQEPSLLMLIGVCHWLRVPIVVSVHTDVAKISSVDADFSFLRRWFGSAVGRLHCRIALWFTHLGYRLWARGGATYFSVSEQSHTILANAGVPDKRVLKEVWGPMVDRKVFRIDQPKDQIEETRRRLTFGRSDAYLLVYVGRVTAEKDVQFLVDALKRAPKRVVLALIGPGSLAKGLSKQHGAENRLYCTGDFVDRDQVALAMRAADCCVSASTMETIGFTAMEALSCGVPMLAANAQGFAMHLSHGKNARLWTPLDEASFDCQLEAMMATKREGCWSPEELRESMAYASVDACTDRVLKVYGLAAGMMHRSFPDIMIAYSWVYLNWFFAWFIK